MRSELVVVAVKRELPQLAAAAVTQLANIPLRQEPRTQSLLVKVANGKRIPSRLHSLEQPLVVTQVLVVAPLEWVCLITTKLGPRAAGALQFSWLLELTTSLALAVVAVAVTPLPVVQVEEPLGHLEFYLETLEVEAVLKLPAALPEMGRMELPASSTQVAMQAPQQPALQEVKVVVVAAAGTAAAVVATTLVAVAALVT
jgi:hypothetical protein